jgi:hypothetical protein
MRKIAIIAGLLLFCVAASAGWQLASAYIANAQLQEDLKDLSSLTGTRIGLVEPRTPDEIRDLVIGHAAGHGIHLDPGQVTVVRNGEGKDGTIFLSTEYDAPMKVFGFGWTIHFTAASPRT